VTKTGSAAAKANGIEEVTPRAKNIIKARHFFLSDLSSDFSHYA
jgi:hypothetical protein